MQCKGVGKGAYRSPKSLDMVVVLAPLYSSPVIIQNDDSIQLHRVASIESDNVNHHLALFPGVEAPLQLIRNASKEPQTRNHK